MVPNRATHQENSLIIESSKRYKTLGKYSPSTASCYSYSLKGKDVSTKGKFSVDILFLKIKNSLDK